LTASDIADRFEISHRTVYRDLRALNEAGVPIGAETGKGYFLVDGYHLPPVMFTRDEAGSMLIAHKLVEKLTDSSVRQNFESAVDKIKAVLPEKEKDYVNGLNSQVAVFYHNLYDRHGHPNNYLILIQQALADKKCLSISYHALHSDEKTCGRVVDPLGLVFYSNAWHLIGFCKLREEMRDFRVDRILAMEVMDESSSERDQDDLKNYFKDYWNSTDLLEVEVWFHHSVADSVSSSRYYFGYIDEYAEDDGVVMRFAVTEYDYLSHWLLSFRDNIKVVRPPELKKAMEQEVKELVKVFLNRG
jgi:predicted DNA-binding transcriptional regulator YafY